MTSSPSADDKRLADFRDYAERETWAWWGEEMRFVLGLLDASRARLTELEPDALMLRKIREVRKGKVGIECCCEFESDGETIVRECSVHAAVREHASALAAALKKYGRHEFACPSSGNMREPLDVCLCGFSEALSQAAVSASPANSATPPAKPSS